MGTAQEVTRSLGDEARAEVEAYLQANRLEVAHLTRADVVLALLRVNTPAALRAAEAIVGRPISRCPPAVPPWKPAPVQKRPSVPVVVRVGRNPCLPTSGAFQRYRTVRPGMTRESLMARGVTARDLRKWKSHVEFGP